jgi:hypothetical protein
MYRPLPESFFDYEDWLVLHTARHHGLRRWPPRNTTAPCPPPATGCTHGRRIRDGLRPTHSSSTDWAAY